MFNNAWKLCCLLYECFVYECVVRIFVIICTIVHMYDVGVLNKSLPGRFRLRWLIVHECVRKHRCTLFPHPKNCAIGQPETSCVCAYISTIRAFCDTEVRHCWLRAFTYLPDAGIKSTTRMVQCTRLFITESVISINQILSYIFSI